MASMELIKTILKDSANLKAYFRFESGALTTDSSGNGYTLTNTNTCTEVTGKFGGGASTGASNTNKRFSIANNLGIAGNGDMSVSFWVNINTDLGSGVYYTLFSHRSTTTADRGLDIMYMKDPTKYVYIGNSGVTISTAIDLGTGTWHHIVATRISGVSTLYIDGAFKASGNQGSTTYSTNQVLIGGDIGSYASIQVDDVAVFNSALSVDQIKELYEGRNLGELRPQTGLVGLWHLNGNSNDSSGNGLNGSDTAITYSSANGKLGQGALFNNTSSSINLGNSSTLAVTNNLTISCWISRNYINDNMVIVARRGTGTQYQIYLRGVGGSGGALSFFNGSTEYISSYIPSQNVWTYIVCTVGGGNLTFYANGKQVYQTSLAGLNTVTENCYIGSGAGNGWFGGKIDEVGIFNVLKSAAWIKQQYSLGRFGEL